MMRLWPLLMLLTISLSLVAGAWFYGIRINLTPSMPKGLYRIVDGPVQRGDIVSLCPPDPWGKLGKIRGYTGDGQCPDGSRPLLKILAGIEGDTVSIGSDGIRINGFLQDNSTAQAQDRHGRNICSILESGKIPQNRVLVLAPVSWSFDGRYFGLVPKDILHRMQPIITFYLQE